MVKKTAIRL